MTSDQPEIVTFRFSRVVFGVSSSPFLLNATLQHHNIKKYAEAQPTVVENLLKSIYVDDVVGGAELTPRSRPTSSTREPSNC